MRKSSAPGVDPIGYLTGKTAQSLEVPLHLVEKIIRHQFMAAAEATSLCNSVEISGIGYLYVSIKKTEGKLLRAQKILSHYLDKLQTPLSPARLSNLQTRIKNIKITINTYESRLERTRPRCL